MSMCAEEAWLERQLIKMGGLLGLWRGTGEMNIFYEQIDFHCEKLKKMAKTFGFSLMILTEEIF